MVSGPSAAHAVASETMSFLSDGTTISAFLAKPGETPEPVPTVIILHEWWGLTDQIKDVARRFAQRGMAALAPDLYSRQGNAVTTIPEKAAALMNGLDSQRSLRDLNAGTRFLTTQSFVDPWRIGMVGFSMGGTLALTQAGHNSDLKACVAFYGKVPPIESINYFTCPVMFHAAGKDAWVTQQEVDRLAQGLEKFGKQGVVHRYPEADHAFFNDTRPEVYRVDDARLAWERTVQFLAECLA